MGCKYCGKYWLLQRTVLPQPGSANLYRPETVDCAAGDAVSDNHILGLLSCESSGIFLRYFKDSLNELIQTQFVNRSIMRIETAAA